MNQADSQDNVSHDDALLVEVARVSGLLGSYVVAFLGAGWPEPSVGHEMALADRVASVADGLRARADSRAAAQVVPSAGRYQQENRPLVCSTASAGHRPQPSDEVTVLRWPFLARLVELPGPPWQFGETRNGAVMCSRTCEGHYTENVCIIGVDHARLTRTPIPRGPRRSAAHVDFTGPLGAIVEVLQEPVRWVNEP